MTVCHVTRSVRGRRARRALQAATVLDRLVDDQLPLLSALSDTSRTRVVSHLAEVAELAAAYRAHAVGSITRAELVNRAGVTLTAIEAIRAGAAPVA